METVTTTSRQTERRAGWLGKTAAYYASFIMLGLIMSSMGPTLPGLAAHTGTRLDEISFLFTARALGGMVGAILSGRVYDARPGHPVLAGTLLVMSILLFTAPLLGQLLVLTAVLFLLGIMEGSVDVGTNALLVWVHREKVGPFMNGLHFFFGVGAFLSPIIVAQALLLTDDVTWAYWTLALLALPVALLVSRLPSPEAVTVDESSATEGVDTPLVIIIAIFLALYVSAEVSFGGWIFSYATRLQLADEATAAYLNSAFWGAFTLGRLVSIPLAARMRPRTILLASLVGALLSVGAVVLWPVSTVVLWGSAIGAGASFAAIFPTALSLAERRMAITGRVTGWFFVGASVGAMAVPTLIGQLFERIGPRVTMTTILLDLVLTFLVFGVMMLRASGRLRRFYDSGN